MNKKTLGLGGLLIALLALLLPGSPIGLDKLGGASPGLSSSYGTSSTLAVGQATVSLLFRGTSYCASRVVTTDTQPIYIQFTSSSLASSSLTVSQGVLQAASTTVTYDGETYGCGTWAVKGAGSASGTVSIVEFR